MSEITTLSQEEKEAIETSFPIRSYTKGSFLLREGQVAKDAYLLIEGCVRKYILTAEDEITLDLYLAGDSVADFYSLASQKPSKASFVCTEDSTLAVINTEKEAELYHKHPRFESICRVEFEKMMGGREEFKTSFQSNTPEDNYLKILRERPALLNKVPQYQIASYLGIKPETLSRIRKRIAQ